MIPFRVATSALRKLLKNQIRELFIKLSPMQRQDRRFKSIVHDKLEDRINLNSVITTTSAEIPHDSNRNLFFIDTQIADKVIKTDYNNALKIPDILGIQYANNLTLDDISRISQFGFKSIRLSINPQTADPAKFDPLIHAMWDNQITPILVLISPDEMNSANVRDQFIKASAEIAARYANGSILWDAWNEPTSSIFWHGTATPKIFADYAAKLIPALKSAAPHHKIMMPSIQRLDQVGKTFLTAVFDAHPELLKQIDYIAVHTYGPANGSGPFDPESKIKALVGMRTALLKKFGQIPQLVISEFGWHTRGGGSVSKTLQGYYAPRLILNAISNQIPLVVYYQWRDEPQEIGVSEPGLQSIDYQPRPGYVSLKKMIENLQGYAFVKSLSTTETKILLFRNQYGHEKIAAWATCNSPVSIKVKSMNGKFITLMNISQTPKYYEIPVDSLIAGNWMKLEN